MGGTACPLYDPGNHRSIERGSDLQAARYGSLTTPAKPAGERESDAALTPRPGTRSAADFLHDLPYRFLPRPGFLSHLRSFNGYDGPEILPSSTRPFCLIGAAGQAALSADDARREAEAVAPRLLDPAP